MKLSHASALTLLALICLPCTGAEQHATANPSVIFSAPLKDVPGKQVVVVALEFAPAGSKASAPHHHPGSVYVYVTRGTARLGLEGQPVQEVHLGQSFFEPPGAVHAVAESASKTESAAAIAVMIVPDGAPLATPEPPK